MAQVSENPIKFSHQIAGISLESTKFPVNCLLSGKSWKTPPAKLGNRDREPKPALISPHGASQAGASSRKSPQYRGNSVQSCYGLVKRGSVAEGVGFEPTDGCPSAVFKTAAIDHSATLPRSGIATATIACPAIKWRGALVGRRLQFWAACCKPILADRNRISLSISRPRR